VQYVSGLELDYLKSEGLTAEAFAQLDAERAAHFLVGYFQFLLTEINARVQRRSRQQNVVVLDASPFAVLAHLCAAYPTTLFSRHLMCVELKKWVARVRPVLLYVKTKESTTDSLAHDSDLFALLRDCCADVTADVDTPSALLRVLNTLISKV